MALLHGGKPGKGSEDRMAMRVRPKSLSYRRAGPQGASP